MAPTDIRYLEDQAKAAAAALEAARKAIAGERAVALQKIKETVAHYGILPREIFEPVRAAITHRGPAGETWTGRGKMPTWLTELVQQGHNPDAFQV